MSAHKIYPVRDNISNTALINKDSYLEMYEASISEPDKFWAEQAAVSYTHLTLPTKA